MLETNVSQKNLKKLYFEIFRFIKKPKRTLVLKTLLYSPYLLTLLSPSSLLPAEIEIHHNGPLIQRNNLLTVHGGHATRIEH
jgi:hypothetical protein